MSIEKEIENKYMMAKRCIAKADEYLAVIDENQSMSADILEFADVMHDHAKQYIHEADTMKEETKKLKDA